MLEIWLYLNFTTTYVPAEHRQNTGYIFLIKLSKNSLHSRINKVYKLKSILIHFWSSNLKANHFHNINFLDLLKFGKHRITYKTLLNRFPASELRMFARHLPGKNRKIWGVRLILQPCPEHYVLRLSRL